MPKDFNNKHEFCFAEIDSGNIEVVQLMRVIEAEHGWYGTIKLDKEDLREFKKNFDLKKRRTDIAVDYSHMSHMEAAGWIKDVELREDDTELWIHVEWTSEAKAKLEDKQYKYLSADFSMSFVDEETGEKVGKILHGAGLTNRPFIRGMKAIFSEFNDVELSEEQISLIRAIASGQLEKPKEKDEKVMELNELIEEAKKLSADDKAAIADALGIKAEAPQGDAQLSAATEKRLKDLETENKKLKDDAKTAEKERKFNAMLSEGKVVEAQREAFLADDMVKFTEAAEEVNLDEKGSGADEGKPTDEPKTAEEAANKLAEMAEAKAEKDGIEFDEALSEVVRANEKLYNLSEGIQEAA